MEIEIHQLPQSLKLSQDQLEKTVKLVSNEISLNAESLVYIFVTDDYLAEMHGRYLNDPDKTDVITFNLGDEKTESEIYISYERAIEQAREFGVSFDEEITRLMIHGLLHLAGYNDIDRDDRIKMKSIENNLVNKYFTKI